MAEESAVTRVDDTKKVVTLACINVRRVCNMYGNEYVLYLEGRPRVPDGYKEAHVSLV